MLLFFKYSSIYGDLSGRAHSFFCFLDVLPRGLQLCCVFRYIYIGTLSCIVKLPDEVCASHTKRVGENKSFLQLKKFAEVLLTGLSF